ncbi:glycoside hydrolase family 32 protein [Confluentibacter flavum]|uniref:Glycosyl hydrolase family 32 n=1 Tax=Confluentibacter flavum TaxID=1909700 RepID=A0A2N3HKD4_9FLAO|nr:GH32 C-terminal domain-containing protein [Confluentibacter flavum]PKQ45391.1 hypothetical protein CSW08_08490 [Confluentibacter flavum]
MKKSIILIFFLTIFTIHGQVYLEKYRPQYHLSSKDSNMADPKGLYIFDGQYHLFWYGQWEHAISKDLVHWEELPDPMKGGPRPFSHFTGSVVVDKQNTSGFGENSMIAIYTRHFPGDSLPETQCISISKDGGNEFHYYELNPVLDINKKIFRDPQVFWHEPSQLWKMVVAISNEQKILIYESKNLKDWNYCSTFGGLGAKNSFWECPDLFELPVVGHQGLKKWVMIIGRGPNKVQYFVGDFDGKNFNPDTKTLNYLKFGKGIEGRVFENFESNYSSNWKITNQAFSNRLKDSIATDFLGNGYVGLLSNENHIGVMKSKPFTINRNAINFLIAGGQNLDSLCIKLIVDGKVARRTTGNNKKVFRWRGWDVRDLKGKTAQIEILDLVKDTINGGIAIDHIIFEDKLKDFGLEHALWLDYGDDFYATKTWRNYDENLKLGDSVIMISWMGNWKYARQQPSSWGHGFQSLPRKIALKNTEIGYKIIQEPINQLKKLRKEQQSISNLTVNGNLKLGFFQPKKNNYELEAEIKCISNTTFGFNLLIGEGRSLKLTIDPSTSTICLDRTNCTDFVSDKSFTQNFATKMYAPLTVNNNILKLHIFVDKSSIEVFLDDGEIVLSASTYPSESQTGIEVFSNGGKTEFISINAWELSSIWGKSSQK